MAFKRGCPHAMARWPLGVPVVLTYVMAGWPLRGVVLMYVMAGWPLRGVVLTSGLGVSFKRAPLYTIVIETPRMEFVLKVGRACKVTVLIQNLQLVCTWPMM